MSKRKLYVESYEAKVNDVKNDDLNNGYNVLWNRTRLFETCPFCDDAKNKVKNTITCTVDGKNCSKHCVVDKKICGSETSLMCELELEQMERLDKKITKGLVLKIIDEIKKRM